MQDLFELNTRIQSYLRANLLRMEDHERIGPFLAAFDSGTDNPYRNYAVADDGAAPSADEIAALEQAFTRRSRVPRLEYIAAAAPMVEAALIARGFAIENRYPILICLPEFVCDAPAVDTEVMITAVAEDVVAAAEALAEAFGETTAYPDPLFAMVKQGSLLAVARDVSSGSIVGAGMSTPQHEGVTEIAGVGVRQDFRRRGIAGSLTSALSRAAFSKGASLAWLTPGSDAAERIYTRAGFQRASEQLHISKSP